MRGVKTVVVISFFCLLTGILPYSAVQAVVVRQINLAKMTGSAGYIFSGVCINREIRYDKDIEREVYVFTFRVNQMIKGAPRNQFTVRTSKTLVEMKQVPIYNIGDEVVLFLYGESRLGFTSPVGLGQGKFSVRYFPNGEKKVVNENNNLNLFKGMDKPEYMDMFMKSSYQNRITGILTQKSGPVNYDIFFAITEALIRR
jgi:hypothetical protein